MSLHDLVKELGAQSDERLAAIAESVPGRVSYPESWTSCDTEFKYMKWQERPSYYTLRLSAFPPHTFEEMAPVTTGLLDAARKMAFPSEPYTAEVQVTWPPEKFLTEKDLGQMPSVKVRHWFYVRDTDKVRAARASTTHELEVELSGKELTLTVSGEYYTLLPQILSHLKLNQVTLQLSVEDAKKVQEWLRTSHGIAVWWLRRVLSPQLRAYTVLQPDTGAVSLSEKQVIEITLPIQFLIPISNVLGGALLQPPTADSATKLVRLSKKVPRPSKALGALQTLVRLLQSFKPAQAFNQPLITRAQAQGFLEWELAYIAERMQWDPQEASQTLQFLALDLFEREIFELHRPNAVTAPQYLALLQGHGFVYEQEMEFKSYTPDWQRKLAYLYAFLRQAHRENPDRLLDKYVASYVSKPPEMDIRGTVTCTATYLPQLCLPTQATVFGFEIKQGGYMQSQVGNELVLNTAHTGYHCWTRVTIESPHLLALQNQLCESLGIVCT